MRKLTDFWTQLSCQLFQEIDGTPSCGTSCRWPHRFQTGGTKTRIKYLPDTLTDQARLSHYSAHALKVRYAVAPAPETPKATLAEHIRIGRFH